MAGEWIDTDPMHVRPGDRVRVTGWAGAGWDPELIGPRSRVERLVEAEHVQVPAPGAS